MRILVDYRPALRARTGVGEYIHELVRAYTAVAPGRRRGGVHQLVEGPARARHSARSSAPASSIAASRCAVLNYLWHRAEWPPVEWLAGEADVVHAAHPLLIPATRAAAQVVTIHDLFFLSHPERTTAEIRRDYPRWRRARAPRRRGHHRLAVHAAAGHRTAREWTPIASTCARRARRTWARLGPGAERARRTATSCSSARSSRARTSACCSTPTSGWSARGGRGAAAADRRRRATPAPAPGWSGSGGRRSPAWCATSATWPTTSAKRSMPARARWCCRRSTKGFGLPALEAMSAGIPVVASNAGALPKSSATPASSFDPTDADALADALDRLAADDAWARERAAAGLARARASPGTRRPRAAARLRRRRGAQAPGRPPTPLPPAPSADAHRHRRARAGGQPDRRRPLPRRSSCARGTSMPGAAAHEFVLCAAGSIADAAARLDCA